MVRSVTLDRSIEANSFSPLPNAPAVTKLARRAALTTASSVTNASLSCSTV